MLARALPLFEDMGRPRIKIIKAGTCRLPSCQKRFSRFVAKSRPDPAYCSIRCSAKGASESRRIIPDNYEYFHNLYITKELSLPKIAEMHFVTHSAIWQVLKRLGIDRRRCHTVRRVCRECHRPTFKRYRKNGGYWYGGRCKLHDRLARARASLKYVRKMREAA